MQRGFSKGLTFGVVYTFSKATTANSDQDTQDRFNPLLDYRAAGWDRTHVFAANYIYDLPGIAKHFGGPKWLSYVTDHYQLAPRCAICSFGWKLSMLSTIQISSVMALV